MCGGLHIEGPHASPLNRIAIPTASRYLSNIPFFSSIGARPSRTVPQLVLYCGYFSLLGVRPLSSMSCFVSRQRWSSPWDSNPQPAAYKAAALPIEPEEHTTGGF